MGSVVFGSEYRDAKRFMNDGLDTIFSGELDVVTPVQITTPTAGEVAVAAKLFEHPDIADVMVVAGIASYFEGTRARGERHVIYIDKDRRVHGHTRERCTTFLLRGSDVSMPFDVAAPPEIKQLSGYTALGAGGETVKDFIVTNPDTDIFGKRLHATRRLSSTVDLSGLGLFIDPALNQAIFLRLNNEVR